MSHFALSLAALLCLALAACGDEPPAQAALDQSHRNGPAMPAGSWAPEAPYDEARLSPFGPVKRSPPAAS